MRPGAGVPIEPRANGQHTTSADINPATLNRIQELIDSRANATNSADHITDPWGWHRLQRSLSAVDVTRISEITGLDRVGIPVFQAVVPTSSARTCVYHAGGLDADEARSLVALTAIAREYACEPIRTVVICSVNDARDQDISILDPRDGTSTLDVSYDDDVEVAWGWGYDLLGDSWVLVPVESAAFSWPKVGGPVYASLTDGGVGSGFTFVEAVLDGIYDVLQRDAWSIASAIGQAFHQAANTTVDRPFQSRGFLQPIALASLPDYLQGAADCFAAVEASLHLFSVVSDHEVPTVLAIANDAKYPARTHRGLGTDLDPVTAATKAVVGVAQARATAAAEGWEHPDLDSVAPAWIGDGLQPDTGPVWPSRQHVGLVEVRELAAKGPLASLRNVVSRLDSIGLDRIIVVDLAPAQSAVAACRVLVPGAETWGIDQGEVGVRLTAAWNAAAAEVNSETMDA